MHPIRDALDPRTAHVLRNPVAFVLATLRRALEYLVPGEGRAVVVELRAFLDHREVIGWVLLITARAEIA